ncbi:ferrous-iron efflux pump FieF [Maritimibacter alkaliphilus HTCC2654]|uniref:Putative transport system permease protein n=1 Tax=Maritimibacter alkaliphilus HTCC2654 TaxID=314271 RepID=A3VHW5_9RHOB|nr:cation diffusion facilitator family transporter [Maritimibacter alkaliphilus]EAQ12306.1 putative transport system permease protein [Rhodobacterales bacterium HTCC2654] [Maritimibacter alkaliphilus HTCC2654]TYP85407.1 ferrous-iron efflux pump FieF [Maritimibacter alkaliphilus HTCC2654]
MANSTRMNLSAGIASSLVALTLVGLKIWALGDTRALSVGASLIDSAMDLMISLGGLAAIAYAARPADEDHAFGHSSAEDLAALGQSLFIMVSAGVITWASVARLLSDTPTELANERRGIVVMVVSIILTVCLVLWQRHVAKRTGSRVVAADSLHYLGDLIPNLGAIASLWASVAFGLTSIDSIVAIGAALMLVVGALNIFRGAFNALMDRAADDDMIAGIEDVIRDFPGVHGFHDLKTRMAGSVTFVNVHIELDGRQTLDEAHTIGAALRREILKAFPNTDVLIHKDPVGVEPHPEDPSRR